MPSKYITPPDEPIVIAIPAGKVMPWEVAAQGTPVAASARVPLLAMRVDAPLARVDKSGIAFRLGLIELDNGVSVVTLRLQIDVVQIHWLAHPEDPELWGLLDAWKRAGRAAFILEFGERCLTLAVGYGGQDDVLRSWFGRRADFDVESFADAAVALAVTGAIAERATSDIPAVREVEHVRVAMLSTSALEKVMTPRVIAPQH